jgi:hypothetical protein
MQMPRRRPFASQPRLLFRDPSQAEQSTNLSPEQQQTCQELLSQILQQILRDQSGAKPNEERSAGHERQTST